MRLNSGRVSTWVSEQGLTFTMSICNKVSIIKGFDDVITKSAGNYQFIGSLQLSNNSFIMMNEYILRLI